MERVYKPDHPDIAAAAQGANDLCKEAFNLIALLEDLI